jgi:predicted metal-dependent hydrolase
MADCGRTALRDPPNLIEKFGILNQVWHIPKHINLMLEEIKYRYDELGEKSAEVIFKRSLKAKYIRININAKLKVRVIIPKRARIEEARKFFETKITWVINSIVRLKARTAKRSREDIKKLTAEEFLERNQYLIKRCKYLAAKNQIHIGKILLKRQKTIWGSCSIHNDISLNSNLVFLEDKLIDYVILHELAHTKIRDHSKRFWNHLEKLLPNSKTFDKQLRNFEPKMATK